MFSFFLIWLMDALVGIPHDTNNNQYYSMVFFFGRYDDMTTTKGLFRQKAIVKLFFFLTASIKNHSKASSYLFSRKQTCFLYESNRYVVLLPFNVFHLPTENIHVIFSAYNVIRICVRILYLFIIIYFIFVMRFSSHKNVLKHIFSRYTILDTYLLYPYTEEHMPTAIALTNWTALFSPVYQRLFQNFYLPISKTFNVINSDSEGYIIFKVYYIEYNRNRIYVINTRVSNLIILIFTKLNNFNRYFSYFQHTYS